MASKSPQTMAKRAREQAVREKRELKQARKAARKAEAAAERAGLLQPTLEGTEGEVLSDAPDDDAPPVE